MHIWQVQEAKAKLTQLLNDARTEPQMISRRGVLENVVMSLEKYQELMKKNENLVLFLRNSPLQDLDLDIERDKTLTRDFEL